MDSEPRVTEMEITAAALVQLAQLGVSPDVLGLLTHGNACQRGSVAPGALQKAIASIRQAALIEGARAGLEAGRENWDGLARSLMMAFDMQTKTPRAIFKHLDLCGMPIPQWMRDESEMKHLDHVPSKGTRAVLIYRAMTEDIDPAAIIAQYMEKQG
ncbi:hypothetical protein J2792_002305 [Novosphingobium capsulatum]|uniref:Uncharacterized protein n=1 Tax=Novosphingobium capsulatum TaxID=13688 RepID=A0ABU1MM81_9SPHN|nr:hypothetical protein [Novosphingobium capsulatum]MDR6511433.1 hypothetical protein [Novosphingobium capsulatum]